MRIPRLGRAVYGVLAALLLVVIVVEVLARSTGYWQLAAFGLGPDLALFASAGRGLAPGQISPRGVPVYNAVHRFWGPAALFLISAIGVLPAGYLIGALTWAFHIAVDRTLGFGLRRPDGFIGP